MTDRGAPGAVSDSALARRISGGPAGATQAEESELYRRFAPRVRFYGLRHLGDEAAAQDLAQEVLLAAATGVPEVLDDPAPSVSIGRLAETGIEVTLFAWAKTYELGSARTALVMAVRDRMDAAYAESPPDCWILASSE